MKEKGGSKNPISKAKRSRPGANMEAALGKRVSGSKTENK